MKNTIITSTTVIAFALVVAAVFNIGREPELANALDEFAQCLNEKGFTMYGAYWCPHCQNEKTAFGDSFRFVNYVECTQEPQQCLATGIKGYPTWITDDGRRFEGEQGIERLAEASGCAIDNAPITQ